MADIGGGEPFDGEGDSQIAIDYVKSQDFRVVWADGAIGSLTPQGKIHLALYAERPSIPRRQVFEIESQSKNQAKLGPEIVEKRISRNSIVREMACDVFLTPETAVNIANWLLQRAEEHRKRSEGDQ